MFPDYLSVSYDYAFTEGNLNPNSSKFYVPSDPNLTHKPQCTNPNIEHVRASTS